MFYVPARGSSKSTTTLFKFLYEAWINSESELSFKEFIEQLSVEAFGYNIWEDDGNGEIS